MQCTFEKLATQNRRGDDSPIVDIEVSQQYIESRAQSLGAHDVLVDKQGLDCLVGHEAAKHQPERKHESEANLNGTPIGTQCRRNGIVWKKKAEAWGGRGDGADS